MRSFCVCVCVCVCVCQSFQLLNQWTDFHDSCYERHLNRVTSNSINNNNMADARICEVEATLASLKLEN
jgi:hypothetical protein